MQSSNIKNTLKVQSSIIKNTLKVQSSIIKNTLKVQKRPFNGSLNDKGTTYCFFIKTLKSFSQH